MGNTTGQDILPKKFEIRSWLFKKWISYPVEESYSLHKSPMDSYPPNKNALNT